MQSLASFLDEKNTQSSISHIIQELMTACVEISSQVQRGALCGVLGSAEQENVQGETQKLLDVISNDVIKDKLATIPEVKGLASEEEPLPVACNEGGDYLVLFDPLDGSSNIDVNVTVGTIFSILKCPEGSDAAEEACYLQDGNQQVAAGYVLYGPSTLLVFTTGEGVHSFSLNPENNEFVLVRENIQIPQDTKEFAINMSNQRFWLPPMQNYVNDLLQGEEGPLGKRYNMRWIASMVAEIHRILTRGGIFMYPYDEREPSKPGKLRLMYEGNPMSMLVEQAGGKASTSTQDIMNVEPTAIHQRVSVIMGSANEVDNAVSYHK